MGKTTRLIRRRNRLKSCHCFPRSMVLELAAGDLMDQYEEEDGREFSFPLGTKIVLGAAKGIAHMHAMPQPVVHRDIKSINIMVMRDDATGKIGDCGESRRVAFDSTMTRTGSPLWMAPEILAGKRFGKEVDVFSFGVVLFEIAVRELPYADERLKYKRAGGKGLDRKMLKDIGRGKVRPSLAKRDATCKRYGVGRAYRERESIEWNERIQPCLRLESSWRYPFSSTHVESLSSLSL